MRVVYLNINDSSEKCLDGFRLYSENDVQACGQPVSNGDSCVEITFSSGNIKYSQVCGKVMGYQVGSTDGAVSRYINGVYIDGISLTHGSPCKHIWNFIGGACENHNPSLCCCGTSGPTNVPSFVGTCYYCESGNPNKNWQHGKFYNTDLLWDGQACGSIEKPCCARSHIPWFHKQLGFTTTDSIEMRLCCDEWNT